MKNLNYGLGCRLGFPPVLMDFVRGAVPERGMKPGLIAVSVQSMMPRSLIAFLLVCYILLVDEFFPARVALNDICFCAVRGTRRFFPPKQDVYCDPRTRHEKSSHPRWADSSEPPLLRGVLNQFDSHASLPWRSQQFFSSRRPPRGLPGTRILPGCEHR